MKLSIKWLENILKADLDASKLADDLTMLGIEVENITRISPPLDKIITARIEKIDRHPNADKLTVCKVNDGHAVLNVVCGASNIREGDIIPLALSGTVLPGDKKIQKSKIRGEISEGMLCSEEELHLGTDKRGIFILSPETKIGVSLKDIFDLDDIIFEVSLTPNRGDGLSLKGISREICALRKSSFGKVNFLNDVSLSYDDILNRKLSVKIEDIDLCPLYGYGIVADVAIGPSPFPLRYRLSNCGVRPINNIVDITNSIMLELGHPMHAFDLDSLQGGSIIVRKSRSGEKINTLDGKEHILDNNHLLVADAARPIALAGIMGGANTEVSEKTRNIVFECAYFNPSQVRKTSKALNISSEASYRFERSVDFSDITESILKAYQMVSCNIPKVSRFSKPLCEGKAPARKEIPFRWKRCQRILGVSIPQQDIKEILADLGFSVKEDAKDKLDCIVPAHRQRDIEREIDIIEEVARVYGYNKIHEEKEVVIEEYSPENTATIIKDSLMSIMPAQGMNEVISYCFISKKESDLFCGNPAEVLELNNPISDDLRYLRTSMIPSLCQIISTNLSYGIQDIRIFEIGKTYRLAKEGITEEKRWLAYALAGEKESKDSFEKNREYDFFDIKGITENISGQLKNRFEFVLAEKKKFFQKESLDIFYSGKNIGTIGMLTNDILGSYAVKKDVYYGEISLEGLHVPALFESKYSSLKRFPSVVNDISFLAERTVSHKDICEAIEKLKITELETIRLYDIYEGKNISSEKKSMTYALRFRSDNRTLTGEEVREKVTAVIKALKDSFSIEIRV
jgi:phenylalanyl-tRNA synthetase beta chain